MSKRYHDRSEKSSYGIMYTLIGEYFISKLTTLNAFNLHFEELPSAKILAKYRRQATK